MADRWEDYFDPGETLLWQGHPLPNNKITFLVVGLALFGAPFLIAGLFCLWTGVGIMFGSNASIGSLVLGIFVALFGLPFVAAGLGMIFGPWYMQSSAHRKVKYALSDRRAYIGLQWWSQKLEAIPISPDATITLEKGRSVYFRKEVGRDSDGDKTTERKGFENIADAAEVYRLVREVQQKAKARRDD